MGISLTTWIIILSIFSKTLSYISPKGHKVRKSSLRTPKLAIISLELPLRPTASSRAYFKLRIQWSYKYHFDCEHMTKVTVELRMGSRFQSSSPQDEAGLDLDLISLAESLVLFLL